jgi:hypothetical protein
MKTGKETLRDLARRRAALHRGYQMIRGLLHALAYLLLTIAGAAWLGGAL